MMNKSDILVEINRLKKLNVSEQHLLDMCIDNMCGAWGMTRDEVEDVFISEGFIKRSR